MELSDLKVFKTVAESGGISSAAKQLHRVPSNVTARIQKLEAELGSPLFIREKNRLYVSAQGEQLLGYASRILNLAEEALEQFNQSAPSGKLRIGTMEAVAASRLSPLLMAYHQKYPKVELEVSTNPTGILIDQTINGQIDLALVADPMEDPRLQITPVFRERLVIVSSKTLTRLNSAEKLGENPTILGFGPRCAYRQRLAKWMERSNISAKVIEINSYQTLLNCVTAEMGVGLVPEILLDLHPFRNTINTHSLPKDMQNSTTFMIWRKDSERASLVAFSEIVSSASNL